MFDILKGCGGRGHSEYFLNKLHYSHRDPELICRCVSPSVNNSTVVDASFHVLLKRSSTPVEQPKAKYVVGVLAIAQW